MSRAFYNLPEPGELGLRWKAFSKAREKIARVERRRREAARAESDLEQKIREEKSDDVKRLAQSILAGEDDPAADTDGLEDLLGQLRAARRQREALELVVPRTEEELRQCIFEHQSAWAEQADKVLADSIAEERAAYEEARQLAEKARKKRQHAEALSVWIRNPGPSFNIPADVLIATTVQQTWGDDLGRCERQMHERQQGEEGVA